MVVGLRKHKRNGWKWKLWNIAYLKNFVQGDNKKYSLTHQFTFILVFTEHLGWLSGFVLQSKYWCDQLSENAPMIELLKLQLAIRSFSMAQHEPLAIISSIVDVFLVCGIAFCARWLILCSHISCRNFFASILILTDDWLNTYLPVSSVRDDFHRPFHFTIYGTPGNQIHPVTGSIIYPRCLKRIGGISLLSWNRTSVWQQSLQGILRLVLLMPF